MKVAKSLFDMGPDDTLATVDAYNKPVSSYETPVADEPSGEVPDSSSVTSDRALADKKTASANNASAKAAAQDADAEASLNELSKMAGESADPMAGLSDEERAAVKKALKDAQVDDGYVVANKNLGSTVITPAGEYGLDKNGDFKAKAGLKVFANVMGDSFICGLMEETGKISNATKALFDLSLDIDIVECISELVRRAKSQKLRKELIRQAGAGFAKKGQLHGLANLLENVGPEEIEGDEIEIVPTVLQNYRRPKSIKEETHPTGKRPVTANDDAELYQQMDTTLTQFDENWGYYNRDGVWVPDAQIHRKLSPDAEAVMGTDRQRRTDIAVAKANYPQSRQRRAKTQYPYAVIEATA
jgi:hypothetical protein